MAAQALPGEWPESSSVRHIEGETVEIDSTSPFMLRDVGTSSAEPTAVAARLFMPEESSADDPVPGAVLLHGAGGVLWSREMTYARQLSTMGVAALVIDSFAARRERAKGYVDRLMEVTESMLIADAFAGLEHFYDRPDVDGERVALLGFSYGGMATLFAAYEQVAETFAPDGARFAGHAAVYAPCVASFRDRRATGAPVLMLAGAQDAIVDRERCAEVARDLSDDGARVDTIVYPDAYHQWDGMLAGPRTIGHDLSGCRFVVERDGTIRDGLTSLPMTGPLTRKIMIALCADREGYYIGRDDTVRDMANRDLGNFLGRVLFPESESKPDDDEERRTDPRTAHSAYPMPE